MVTERRRIWDYMVRSGPVTCRDIAESLNLTTRRVNNHLRNIAKVCQLERKGLHGRPHYHAKGPYRCLGRGGHPNSKKNIRTWGEFHRAGLIAMWKARKINEPKPKPKTALEQCWGWGIVLPENTCEK